MKSISKLTVQILAAVILCLKLISIILVWDDSSNVLNVSNSVISICYYICIFFLMFYFGYLGKWKKTLTAVFFAELLILSLSCFESVAEFGPYLIAYLFVGASHDPMLILLGIKSWWQFFVYMALFYIICLSVLYIGARVRNQIIKKTVA